MEKINGVYAVENKLGGKNGVRFPTDNLSAKEKRALNGKCVTYDISTFNKPTTWETLRSWPDDIQRDYLKKCYWTHGGTTHDIAEMLGTYQVQLHRTMVELGVPMRKKGGKGCAERHAAWKAFLTGGQTLKDAIPEETKKQMLDMVTEREPVKEPPKEVIVEKKEPPAGNSVLALAALLEQFKGTGARVTLELVL